MGGLLVSFLDYLLFGRGLPFCGFGSVFTDWFLLAFQFPQAVARLEELRKGDKSRNVQQGKLTRDKKKDDENCVVM
jgi:hypothetical protein